MKVRRCRQLLPKIRRGIDQKPVLIIGADRDRSLRALQARVLTRSFANRTSAIPLRYAASGRGSQNDDA
jgi:hypothetical protein